MQSGRTLTSAWIETMVVSVSPVRGTCRTLTSAWIETMWNNFDSPEQAVALSRVRGLKQCHQGRGFHLPQSHSHECVD